MTIEKIQVSNKDINLWLKATPLKFSYPFWIRKIPIKFIREKLKTWYWYNGGEEHK